ncbi:MAG TPA: glycosyl transferase [Anaerolineae bacterium]|nr:glycosyl transferase [Anaerolineae bacterium]
MRHFCTYFDHNYLLRGLTLYASLARHAGPFVLWVLCLDDATYAALSKLDLPDVRAISLPTFERDDNTLMAAKRDRSPVEYYFTCTPSWLSYLLEQSPPIDMVTYLDADLFFYSSPEPIYEEMGNGSVLIVGHRFPEKLRSWERYGIYNVGYLTFRNDSYGRQCLHWWRDRCLEWCYDRVEDNRFADQKYLDDWPTRFPQLVVLRHKGAGLAPWNVENYSLTLRNGRVLVDSEPLVFFHFHNFQQVGRRLYDPGLARYRAQASRVLKRQIYSPYVRGLSAAGRSLRGLTDHSQVRLASIRQKYQAIDLAGSHGSAPDGLVKDLRERYVLAKKVYHGDLWLSIHGWLL